MVDFAKSPGVTNSDALITNAIAYRRHPRNSENINGVLPSTPYCQRAPRNSELQGVVNAQLAGVDPGIYGGPSFGLVAFGDRELLFLSLEQVLTITMQLPPVLLGLPPTLIVASARSSARNTDYISISCFIRGI